MSNNYKVEDPVMLSTIDNPFDPFTQFDEWYQYDEQAGYQSCSLLARVSFSSDELSEADQLLAVEQAIDEIVQENVSGVHIKVRANDNKQDNSGN